MKRIEQKILHFKEGNSDKVYEVDLCDAGSELYLVNFRYGKRGTTLQEGTKTVQPVPMDKARKIFDKLVEEKTKKGYQDISEGAEAILQVQFKASTNLDAAQAKRENVLENLRIAADSLKLHSSRRWKAERVAWRAGELFLHEGFAYLLELCNKGSAMLQYSSLWAIARCYQPESHSELREAALAKLQGLWAQAVPGDKVERMTALALAVLQGQNPSADFSETLRKRLPENLGEAVASKRYDRVSTLLLGQLANRKKANFDFLPYYYLLSLADTQLRKPLYELLKTISLEAGSFRGFRHLFKMAENRLDGQMLGLISYRIESSKAGFTMPKHNRQQYNYELRRYISPKSEIKKNDSVLAYSDRTRKHFFLRCAELMEELGKTQPKSYLHFATSLLLQYDDAKDAGQIDTQTNWKYSSKTKRYEKTVLHFDTYANKFFFYHILFAQGNYYTLSPARKNQRVACTAKHAPSRPIAADVRTEAYPELWDQNPQALMHLVMEAKAERVINFALNRLQQLPAAYQTFLAHFKLQNAMELLQKPFQALKALSLDIIKKRYNPQEPNLQLLLNLLNSDYGPARKQGMTWIEEGKSILFQQNAFIRGLLLHPQASVRQWIETQLPEILGIWSNEQVKGLAGMLLSQILSNTNQTEQFEICLRLLQGVLLEPLKTLNLDVLGDLLQSGSEKAQNLGALILENHHTAAIHLPISLYRQLLESSNSELHRVAVVRLGQCPSSILKLHAEWATAFLLSPAINLRQGLRSLFRSLWKEADMLSLGIKTLLPAMLRKEAFEGAHVWAYELLTQDLEAGLAEVERKMIFRLLNSEYGQAQDLAALLLARYIDPASMSVRNLIRLSEHEILAVRQVAWSFFEQQVPRMRYEAEEALRLLDAKWDDSRAFAFQYFQQNFGAADWTPSLLVSVIDSVRKDVQAFGRRLLDQYFTEEEGENYLLQLSQHPSVEVQNYAGNYLNRFAAGNTPLILSLEFYFISVLSRVNKGRVSKTRVMEFLRREALAQEEVAQLALRIFNNLSAADVVEDRAWSIALLHDLAVKYPQMQGHILKINHLDE